MTAKNTGTWDIIETLGTVPTLIARNMQTRLWKPIHNEYRGKELELVKALIFTVIEQLKTTQSLFTGFTHPKIFYAIPVLGPQRQVHGINLWQGPIDAEITVPPKVKAWNIVLDHGEPYIEFPRGKTQLAKVLENSPGSLAEKIKVYDIFDNLYSGCTTDHASGDMHVSYTDNGIDVIRYIVQTNLTSGKYLQGISYRLPRDQSAERSIENRLLEWFMAQEKIILALQQNSTGKIRLCLNSPIEKEYLAMQDNWEKSSEVIIKDAGIDTAIIAIKIKD